MRIRNTGSEAYPTIPRAHPSELVRRYLSASMTYKDLFKKFRQNRMYFDIYQEGQPVTGRKKMIHDPLQVTGEVAEEAGDGGLGLQVDDLQEEFGAHEGRHAVLGQEAGKHARLTPLQHAGPAPSTRRTQRAL